GAISISGWIPHDQASLFDPRHGRPDVALQRWPADRPLNIRIGESAGAVDLYNAHVPVVFESLDGGGHVPFNTFGDLMISQSVNFSYAVLDLAHAAGQPAAAARTFDAKAAKLEAGQPAWVRKQVSRRR